MCYFDQTVWSCGYWRWGHFRQQCNKEYRMGETCGLKLVYETRFEQDSCRLCHDIDKKVRRCEKMSRDVQRWQREGNRNATIERTCSEMRDVQSQIARMEEEHQNRARSTQVRNPSPIQWFKASRREVAERKRRASANHSFTVTFRAGRNSGDRILDQCQTATLPGSGSGPTESSGCS